MDNNPCNTVLKPRLERKPVVIWSVEETERFLTAAAETPHYALFLLAVATGMRQGEICALQWEHVDLQNRFLSVVFTLTAGPDGLTLTEPKTRSSMRRIDLPDVVVSALRAMNCRDRRGFVFRSERGRQFRESNFTRRVFKLLIRQAHVRDISFHALRHIANSYLLASGESPNVVAERMGHASTRMTLDTYGHVLAGAQRAAADKIQQFLGSPASDGGQPVVKEAMIAPSTRSRKAPDPFGDGLLTWWR